MDSNCSKYAIVAKSDKNLDDARVLVKVLYVRNVRSQQSIPSERTRSIKCVRVRYFTIIHVFEYDNLLEFRCSNVSMCTNAGCVPKRYSTTSLY